MNCLIASFIVYFFIKKKLIFGLEFNMNIKIFEKNLCLRVLHNFTGVKSFV